jgi:hypothetical protein
MNWFGQHQDRDEYILWPPPDRDNQPYAVRYGFLENIDTAEEEIHTGQKCQAQKFVAFPAPMILPVGPVCPVDADISFFERNVTKDTNRIPAASDTSTCQLICQQGPHYAGNHVLHLGRALLDCRRSF